MKNETQLVKDIQNVLRSESTITLPCSDSKLTIAAITRGVARVLKEQCTEVYFDEEKFINSCKG